GFAVAGLRNRGAEGRLVVGGALEAAGFRPPAPVRVDDAPVDEYVGVYETALSRVTISLDEGGIRVEEEDFGGFPTRDSPPGPPLPPMHAYFYGRERWIVDGGPLDGMRGHFIRDGNGEVAWLPA